MPLTLKVATLSELAWTAFVFEATANAFVLAVVFVPRGGRFLGFVVLIVIAQCEVKVRRLLDRAPSQASLRTAATA